MTVLMSLNGGTDNSIEDGEYEFAYAFESGRELPVVLRSPHDVPLYDPSKWVR